MRTEIPEAKCYKCGSKMDRATGAFGAVTPKEGDASMCLKCGAVAIFRKDLTLRPPSVTELQLIREDVRIITADILRSSIMANRKKKNGEDP